MEEEPGEEEEKKEDESEEAVKSRVRDTEAVPSAKEVDERNANHAAFRRWCPRCAKGRAETYGRRAVTRDKTEIPRISIDYVYTASEQDREEEKGMPALVMKDHKTKTVMARAVPSKGLDAFAIGRMKKDIEQLGYRRVVTRKGSA